MRNAPRSVALSLISHTNAGKTALARTLLSRDVGEVRDEAHVTEDATEYLMIATAAGERLLLWDTPGFGDSARLSRRLAKQGNPIGWFLATVWDRFRERPLWLAQKAVANVRDHADVVLYLVNASENPADAGYLAPELEVLGWIGKPVLVLLNQAGTAPTRDDEAAEVSRWQVAVTPCPLVRAVLPLDAFARCWPQETVLLDAVADALDDDARHAAQRLRAAWVARRLAQFDAAMAALATPIAQAAVARATLPSAGWRDTVKDLGRIVGIRRGTGDTVAARAMNELARTLDRDIRASTDALIAVHELEGRAAEEVLSRLATSVVTETPTSEGKAAVVAGVVSGALSGLAADLAAGGLTLGAGVLAGGLAGALGGAGLARGYNVVRGTTVTTARWSPQFLDMLVSGALLRYLAVAHHGRGRGAWRERAMPQRWRDAVSTVLSDRSEDWQSVWQLAGTRTAPALSSVTQAALRASASAVLAALYPAGMAASLSATPPASAPPGPP